MIRLSKKLLFAIGAVLDIAYNAGSQPVQSRQITDRQGIPRRYLEQVLQHLVRTGILSGVRGPKGGYRLARERRRITLGDITRVVRAMEASDNKPGAEETSELGRLVVRPIWAELQEDLIKRLDGITVEDLCLRARQGGVRSETQRHLDFTI